MRGSPGIAPGVHDAGAAADTWIDWHAARRFMRNCLRENMGTSDPADLDDLVQEALIRLLRAVRKEPVREVEALMRTIARRTAIDLIRRRRRWKSVRQQLDQTEAGSPLVAPALLTDAADPLDRIRFVVLEFFGGSESSCSKLAQAYFEAKKWEAVATHLQESVVVVRKRWSRCLAQLRERAMQDPSFASLVGWDQG
jgi:RNA polymerase sigma factor (sigma-70 family)